MRLANIPSQNGALHVTFDYNPLAVGTNTYTPQNPNPRFVAVPPHAVRMSGPVNWCLDSQREDDLALVKLGARVPQSIASPMHPPGILGTPQCPGAGNEFYGLLVGYGNRTLWIDEPDDDNRMRNYALASDYVYDDHLYKNTWVVQPWALFTSTWYEGGLAGDSGAPLFQASTGQLCGLHVTHGVFFDIEWLWGFFPIILFEAEANAVALDFDENQAFINARVVDSRGNFMGECGDDGDPNSWEEPGGRRTLTGMVSPTPATTSARATRPNLISCAATLRLPVRRATKPARPTLGATAASRSRRRRPAWRR